MPSRKSIVQDARVLTADYLPNKMVHRDGEREEIARNLRPVLEDGQPRNMLLYGAPGTGKTAMAKYVVEQLQKEKFVESSYVNCFSQKSTFEIFYELLDEKITTPREGTSTAQIIEKFEEKTRENPTVVILDELDQLNEDQTLYELSRFQNVGIIFIANDSNVLGHFEDRVQSRLSGISRIRFKKYSEDELFDILRLRRRHGLKEGSISDEKLRSIAADANGDARVAVNTLRFAAQEAESQKKQEVNQEIIEEAVSNAFNEERLKSLKQLNKHQKAVYEILEEEDELGMSQLYDEYRDRVDDSRTKRTLRRYLNKMEAYNVISAEGEKKGKKYGLNS